MKEKFEASLNFSQIHASFLVPQNSENSKRINKLKIKILNLKSNNIICTSYVR